jgi:hypothetical protein
VMLNFFVQLENTLGLPILLVGTYAADDLVFGRYHQRRRANGEGYFEWTPMEYGQTWDTFTTALWTCQVVRKRSQWTPQLSEALHAVSYGVTDIALRVYRFAQEEAIEDRTEKLTSESLRVTAEKHCPLTEPIISALRDKDWDNEALEDLDDVLPLNRRKGTDDVEEQTETPASPPEGGNEPKKPPQAKRGRRKESDRSRGKERHTPRLQKTVKDGRVKGKSGADALKEGGLVASLSEDVPDKTR